MEIYRTSLSANFCCWIFEESFKSNEEVDFYIILDLNCNLQWNNCIFCSWLTFSTAVNLTRRQIYDCVQYLNSVIVIYLILSTSYLPWLTRSLSLSLSYAKHRRLCAHGREIGESMTEACARFIDVNSLRMLHQ